MKKPKESFVPGYGLELDLDKSTCTPRTLAFLGRPEDEQQLSQGAWNTRYEERVNAGDFEKSEAKEQAIYNHPDFKAASFEDAAAVYERLKNTL